MELNPSDVRKALSVLRARNTPFFGADVHSFELNPILSDSAVVAFEERHRIRLPEDYRRFLTEIGNGGAGPFYGIFPLGQMDEGFGLKSWAEEDGFVGTLSEPFGFETAWNDISKMPSSDLAERSQPEYEREMDSFEEFYWSSSLVNGAIPICHEGCAVRLWLVVTGKQAGHIWEDCRSEYKGIRPAHLADRRDATFGSWYKEWLTACIEASKA